MTIRDLITAGVKTGVQVAVAAGVAWLLNLGIEVDAVAVETAVFAVVTGAVTMVLNALGSKFPIVNTILSFGLSGNSASY